LKYNNINKKDKKEDNNICAKIEKHITININKDGITINNKDGNEV